MKALRTGLSRSIRRPSVVRIVTGRAELFAMGYNRQATQYQLQQARAMKRQQQQIDTTVGDAVSTFFGEITALGEEMREAFENTPENLQSSDVGSRREEAADALESIYEIDDIPDCIRDVAVSFALYPTKRNQSRSARRDDAVVYAYAAKEVVEGLIETWREEEKALIEADPDKTDARISDAEEFLDELQDAIDEAEGVEFPGMFG